MTGPGHLLGVWAFWNAIFGWIHHWSVSIIERAMGRREHQDLRTGPAVEPTARGCRERGLLAATFSRSRLTKASVSKSRASDRVSIAPIQCHGEERRWISYSQEESHCPSLLPLVPGTRLARNSRSQGRHRMGAAGSNVHA